MSEIMKNKGYFIGAAVITLMVLLLVLVGCDQSQTAVSGSGQSAQNIGSGTASGGTKTEGCTTCGGGEEGGGTDGGGTDQIPTNPIEIEGQVPEWCPQTTVPPTCPSGTTIRSDCSCNSRYACVCVWPSS
jgi:hypothetical protein